MPTSKTSVICAHCGSAFLKRDAEIKRYPSHFCNRTCRGHYLAEHDERKSLNGVVTPTGCILWAGVVNQHGYGNTSYKGKGMGAHRLAWILKFGAIPDSLHVLHACDNPRCVNVNHLFLGTHQQNMDDKRRKERAPVKLPRHARALVAESTLPASVLAARYKVSERTIRFWRKACHQPQAQRREA